MAIFDFLGKGYFAIKRRLKQINLFKFNNSVILY